MKSSNLHLVLSDGHRDVDLGELTRDLLKCAQYVALKVPVNFAVDDLAASIATCGGRMIDCSHLNLRKMKLLVIKGPSCPS